MAVTRKPRFLRAAADAEQRPRAEFKPLQHRCRGGFRGFAAVGVPRTAVRGAFKGI